MPMFFILSGLFIAKSLKKYGAKKYIESRMRILLYPYLLWAVIQTTFGILFSQYAHATWDLHRYLVILYQPNATSQLWYLATLFNTAALYVLLSACFHMRLRYQFILGVILYFISPFLFFNSMIQDTTRFYVYLVFGSLISDFILAGKNARMLFSIKSFIPLCIAMFFSQYYLFKHQYLYSLEMYFDMDKLGYQAVLQHFWGMLKFTMIVLIGCAFVLNVCTILQRIGRGSFIRVIGYHSLYIYLMHVLLTVACRMFFVNFLHYKNAFVILPFQITVCMIGSVMIYNLARHLGLNFLFEYDLKTFKKMFRNRRINLQYQKA